MCTGIRIPGSAPQITSVMKRTFVIAGAVAIAAVGTLTLFSFRGSPAPKCCHTPAKNPLGCVFKTVYEGEGLDSTFVLKTPAEVNGAQERAYTWMIQAQNGDGGFAAGTHARQDIMDPHAMPSDPATTAMVSMALLRAGSTPENGRFANVLARTTEFLLKAIEGSPEETSNITELTGTQIQVKLGQNIDVALASQYLSN